MTARPARIVSLAAGGDGVSEDGLYVPYAAPGDLLEVEAEGARGTIARIVAASPDRADPVCPHFGVCGACQLQHMTLPAVLAWKREQVARALAQAGLTPDIEAALDAHGEGRRRVTLAIKNGVAGYHLRGSHAVMPVDACPILAPGLARAIPFAQALAGELPDKWVSLLLTATQSGIDADIKGPLHSNARLNRSLAALAREHGLARLTAEREPIAL